MTQIQESVIVMKILCNTHRYAIMHLLLTTKEKHLCVNQIASHVGISQSLASQNLAYLVAHGVAEGHRMGQTICYVPAQTAIAKKIARVIRTLSKDL